MRAPALYSSLPRQIVHRDDDASNVLMEGDRVTGVLDFEVAGPDLLDLARGLFGEPVMCARRDAEGRSCAA